MLCHSCASSMLCDRRLSRCAWCRKHSKAVCLAEYSEYLVVVDCVEWQDDVDRVSLAHLVFKASVNIPNAKQWD